MHGSAQRHDHLSHVLADAGILSLFQVGGDGSDRGAGTQGDHSGLGDVLEHGLHAVLAAAEPGEQRERSKDVDKAQGIVHSHGAAIGAGDLGTVVSDQASEDGEEGHGSIVGDDLDELHHDIGHAAEPLGDQGLRAASHVGGEAEQHGEHDQGQHGLAGQQTHEVAGGEEVDDHVGNGGVLAHFLRGDVVPGNQYRGEDLHQREHDDSSDGAGDDEGRHRGAHDLTGTLHALHVGNGARNGHEHQGNHHAEHHVDEHGAKGLYDRGHTGGQPAHQRANDHCAQHDAKENIILDYSFLFHKFLLLLTDFG